MSDRVDDLHVVEHHREAPGPVVVLVHGSLDRGASFARVVRRLGDHPVVTYDRRGYGRSRHDGAPPATFDGHVDDLLAVVAGRPAVVVGHSFGGDVALAAAVAAPTTVRSVGAYEPPLPWLAWWPRRGGTPLDEDPADVAARFFRRMVGDAAWDRLPEATRAARRAEGPALLAELAAIGGPGPPFALERLAVPAAFGRGATSWEHHRRAVAELAAAVPGALLVDIDGAAHGAHLTHPGAFADLVRSVVARTR